MTSRDLVKKTLEFRSPERVPRQLWTLPWAKNNHAEKLAEIQHRFPDDIVGAPSCLRSQPHKQGDPYVVGTFVVLGSSIALEHGATIDKYIGDAMMVFFGDPESKGVREDARACVEMALRMQERMLVLQKRWRANGFERPFEIRIGINTGYCNVGNFGSEQRLSYTIIGGEVNLTQRLESAADVGGILVSYETYAYVQDMVEAELRGAIQMKGIARDVRTYAIKGRKSASGETSLSLAHPAGVAIDLDPAALDAGVRSELAEQLATLADKLRSVS